MAPETDTEIALARPGTSFPCASLSRISTVVPCPAVPAGTVAPLRAALGVPAVTVTVAVSAIGVPPIVADTT